VVFAEQLPGYTFGDPEQVVSLWHALLSDTTWLSPERIPIPAGIKLTSVNSSRLLRSGDTLFWAMTYASRSELGVVLFTRARGTWSSSLLPLRSAAQVELSHSDSLGVHMLTVGAGPARDSLNLLQLFRYKRGFQPMGTLYASADAPVLGVQTGRDAGAHVITWITLVPEQGRLRQEARALRGNLDGSPMAYTVVDSSAAIVTALTRSDGSLLWVTQEPHEPPQRGQLSFRAATTNPESRIVMPGPFTGPFAIIEDSRSSLFMAGPLLREQDERAPLVTALVRAELVCGSATASQPSHSPKQGEPQ
jgi:hypothetical protein